MIGLFRQWEQLERTRLAAINTETMVSVEAEVL